MFKEYKIIKYILPIAFLFFIFINYLAVSFTVLFYPYDLDYSEGFLVESSVRLLNLKNLYQDISMLPFSVIKYTPVFFLVNSFTMILFGVNLFSARLISFISSIMIGCLIYLIVHKQSKSKFFGSLSSLLFFSSFVTFFTGSLARVDVLATFFSLLGIYFMTKYKKRENFLLAIIFFILAVCTKQIFIAAPVASFVYLITKDRKNGFRFLSFFLLFSLAIFISINILSQGKFFLNIFKYSTTVWAFDRNLFIYLFLSNFLVLCVAIYAFLRKPKVLLSLYFIFSLFILVIELMRPGGSVYYFFELTVITSILTGILLNDFRHNPNKIFFITFIIILQLILFIQRDPRVLLSIFQPKNYPPLINLATDAKISSYINNSPGNVLVEHATLAIKNGKDILIEPYSVYELETNGNLNSSEILEFIKSKNCSLITFYSRFDLVKGLRNYIENNYELIDNLGWKSLESADWTWKIYRRI